MATSGSVQDESQKKKLADALRQLQVEPTDDAARAAKFELYEGFAKLTEDARTAVHALWDSAQGDLEAANATATKAQIEQDLRHVDRRDNLGIDFENSQHWFVHGMCTAAARNQRLLDGVLGSITTKLELLSSQSECPVCFESFDSERPSTTLGCAHRVCSECWGHWSAMGGAVCPLCRHTEFLGQVLRAASNPS